jgi:hypothetical protein
VEASGTTASHSPDPEAIIKKIKANPDFKVHEETIDVPVPGTYTGPTPDLSGSWWQTFASLMGVAWYVLLAGLVALLCWLIYKFRHVFKRDSSSRKSAKTEGPKTVLGLDVAPEALPSDIPGAAWQRWLAGDARGALRLLYAGSLSWMISRAGLPIRESDTEGDCMRHSSQLPNPQQTTYFSSLTSSWIGNAYGSISPEEIEMSTLVKGWPFQ